MAQQPEERRSWRDPDWELQTPTTVLDLLRQNPVGPAFWLVVMALMGIGIVGIGFFANELGLHLAIAAPLGLGAGVLAWWASMFAFAKGWIHDE